MYINIKIINVYHKCTTIQINCIPSLVLSADDGHAGVSPTDQIIYWCDSQSDLIETADIDGKNRRTVWKGISTSDQFDVAAHGGFIYWTDWSQKGLFR